MSSVKLINSHCLSTLLCGCEVWCIKQTESYKLNVIWNNVYKNSSTVVGESLLEHCYTIVNRCQYHML